MKIAQINVNLEANSKKNLKLHQGNKYLHTKLYEMKTIVCPLFLVQQTCLHNNGNFTILCFICLIIQFDLTFSIKI